MNNQLLVGPLKKEVQNLILEGSTLTWESYKLEPYVSKATELIFNLQEKIDELLTNDAIIDTLLNKLEVCDYRFNVIAEILEKIQKSVDELSLKMFANLSEWANRLDDQVNLISI